MIAADSTSTWAVIADVHANLPALKAVLADADRRGARTILCLGDVVGYSVFAAEVIDLLRARDVPCVRGNHDLMAAGLLEPVRCGPNARLAIEWTRKTLDESRRAYLAGLPLILAPSSDILGAHSSISDPVIYLRSDEDFRQERERIAVAHPAARIGLTGHTHTRGVVEVKPDGSVVRRRERVLRLNGGSFFFLNPGSVGHPRREDYRASFLLLDPATRLVRFRKVAYRRGGVIAANRSAGIDTDLGPSVIAFRWNGVKRWFSSWRSGGLV